jgi:hypothetical protein
VVVANVLHHPNVAKMMALPGDYFFNLLSWLAEPRRREENRLIISPANGEAEFVF